VICAECSRAGGLNSLAEYAHAKALHLECEYSDCSCQHKTGDKWVKKSIASVRLSYSKH
jgi:hypothetical protein